MPQPFQNLTMEYLAGLSKEDLIKQQISPGMPPNEIIVASKIAGLAHFLVQNFREELSPEEHVIDTAIRLLSKRLNKERLNSEPNPERSVATEDASKETDGSIKSTKREG